MNTNSNRAAPAQQIVTLENLTTMTGIIKDKVEGKVTDAVDEIIQGLLAGTIPVKTVGIEQDNNQPASSDAVFQKLKEKQATLPNTPGTGFLGVKVNNGSVEYGDTGSDIDWANALDVVQGTETAKAISPKALADSVALPGGYVKTGADGKIPAEKIPALGGITDVKVDGVSVVDGAVAKITTDNEVTETSTSTNPIQTQAVAKAYKTNKDAIEKIKTDIQSGDLTVKTVDVIRGSTQPAASGAVYGKIVDAVEDIKTGLADGSIAVKTVRVEQGNNQPVSSDAVYDVLGETVDDIKTGLASGSITVKTVPISQGEPKPAASGAVFEELKDKQPKLSDTPGTGFATVKVKNGVVEYGSSGGTGGNVDDVTVDGVSVLDGKIAKITTDSEVTETSTSTKPVQTQAVAKVFHAIKDDIKDAVEDVKNKLADGTISVKTARVEQGNNQPASSDAVYDKLSETVTDLKTGLATGDIVVKVVPVTQGSPKPAASGSVFDELKGKQATLPNTPGTEFASIKVKDGVVEYGAGGGTGLVEDVTVDGVSVLDGKIAKITTDNEVTETSTSTKPIQTQAVATIYKALLDKIEFLTQELAKKQDILPNTFDKAKFYALAVDDGMVTYGDIPPIEQKHKLVNFAIGAAEWVESVNPDLGTNYRVTITADCNANDALQVYYDMQSILPANTFGIVPGINGANTLVFYAITKPDKDITGRYEILPAETGMHILTPITLDATEWIPEVNPYLGTNFKATKTIGCKANDALQVYYDMQSILPANTFGIVPMITATNTVSFYAETMPNFRITGRTEILTVSPAEHNLLPFSLETTGWVAESNPTLGTNYKITKSISCKANDELQVYYGIQSLAKANQLGVLPAILSDNTACFYSVGLPDEDISGRYEVIDAGQKHNLQPFSLDTTKWVAEVNPALGTNYKATITIACKANDAIQTYYDMQSILPANVCGIMPSIENINTVCFYSVTLPNQDISGRLEVIPVIN